jgi:3-isopropylmalate/(R)-2-methylmalate dehydratase small subunit
VPVQVDPAIGRQLLDALAADPTLELTIDIERRVLAAPALGVEVEFPLDDFTRYRLLNGLDDVGITMLHESDISVYERARPGWSPSL